MKDGSWALTIRKGQAFVPTVARTEAGFYLDVEPVEVVDTSDRETVEQAVIRAVKRGNPVVPTPARDSFPPDPLLKHAKLKSQSAFEKSAQRWQLSKDKGAYLIVPYKSSGHGVSLVEDAERGEAIPADEPLERVVHRLVERALASLK